MQNIGYHVLMSIIRDVTIKAQKYLDNEEILLFIGPRQAGKTTVLKQLQHLLKKEIPYFYLNLEDKEYLKLLNNNPKNIFQIFSIDQSKKSILFIDEVQYLDDPTNFLKLLFDQYKEKLKLIVSGSSAFYLDKKFHDSLAGRKKIFFVYTASFREFLRFKKEDLLSKKHFNKLSLVEEEKLTKYLYEYLIYGGYPRVILEDSYEEKKEILRDLAYSYIKKDVVEAGIRSDENFYLLLKILSQQIGNLVNFSEISSSLGVSRTMISNYFYVMEKSFHIQLIKPFYKNLRKEITKMSKIYFYDLGLRNFFYGNLDNLIVRIDKGQLVENFFFRHLLERYYPEEIKYWRKINGGEVDFVVDRQAYEIKTNKKNINLKKYQNFINKYPEISLKFLDLKDLLTYL